MLDQPWLLSFISCAAPYAPALGEAEASDLLRRRIYRILVIARAFGYEVLVLGAWGCGAFGHDPGRTAEDFRETLENDFNGAFSDIAFAITDWSPERKALGRFVTSSAINAWPFFLCPSRHKIQHCATTRRTPLHGNIEALGSTLTQLRSLNDIPLSIENGLVRNLGWFQGVRVRRDTAQLRGRRPQPAGASQHVTPSGARFSHP